MITDKHLFRINVRQRNIVLQFNNILWKKGQDNETTFCSSLATDIAQFNFIIPQCNERLCLARKQRLQLDVVVEKEEEPLRIGLERRREVVVRVLVVVVVVGTVVVGAMEPNLVSLAI